MFSLLQISSILVIFWQWAFEIILSFQNYFYLGI